jgi:hypothetical protein
VYNVLLERAAEKDLARLTVTVHDRVIASLQGLAQNPASARLPQADWYER